MKKIILAAALVLSASGSIHGQDIITAPTLKDLSSVAGKKNDFGMSFNLGIEKKLAPGFSLDIDGEYRTQDNNSMIERWVLGASLSYRLYRTFDKKFNLKAGAGFEYMWRQKAEEKEYFDKISQHYDEDDGLFDGYTQRKGYKNTSAYWRNRHRTSAFLSATYAPSKRWSFTLKETFQFNHNALSNSSLAEETRLVDADAERTSSILYINLLVEVAACVVTNNNTLNLCRLCNLLQSIVVNLILEA